MEHHLLCFTGTGYIMNSENRAAIIFRQEHTFPPRNICILDFNKLDLSPLNFYGNEIIQPSCFSNIPDSSNLVVFSDRKVNTTNIKNIFCNARMVSSLIYEIRTLKPQFRVEKMTCCNDRFTDIYYELISLRIYKIAASMLLDARIST